VQAVRDKLAHLLLLVSLIDQRHIEFREAMQSGDGDLALATAPLCTREDCSRLCARIVNIQFIAARA
jgi:hypothetical protein